MTRLSLILRKIPPTVELLAVSKTRSIAEIKDVYAQGQRKFAENRVQELLMKQDALKDSCPDIEWHLIGTLQRNKVKSVIGKVQLIHSVHSLALLERIEREASAMNVRQDVLLQINYSGESSKFGLDTLKVHDTLSAADSMGHVAVRGLMTMSSVDMTPEERLDYFRRFRAFYDEIRTERDFDILSIGMSDDYQEAIEAGSTMLRLGTAIFGPRQVTGTLHSN